MLNPSSVFSSPHTPTNPNWTLNPSSSNNNAIPQPPDPTPDHQQRIDSVRRQQAQALRTQRGGVIRSLNFTSPPPDATEPEPTQQSKQRKKAGSGSEPVGIAALSILYDPPVQDVELRPYVLLQCRNGTTKAVEDDDDLKFGWFRSQKRVCAHPNCNKAAKLQCLTSLKLNLPSYRTYFCSKEHLEELWPSLKESHHKAMRENTSYEESRWKNWNHDDVDSDEENDSNARMMSEDTVGNIYQRFPSAPPNNWMRIALSKKYKPTIEDVGRMLLLECAVVRNGDEGKTDSEISRRDTQPVLPIPPPPPKREIIVVGENTNNDPTFKVISYNMLAPIYATKQIFRYCEMFQLDWNYRRNNLIREIIDYDADIICLQEIQSNHFEDFFQPSLAERGYDGIFKAKTREGFLADPKVAREKQIDGCAIFYKKDRFALLEQYHVEFNEAAKHMFETQRQQGRNIPHYNQMMKRLLRGNIALVLVLEELGGVDSQDHLSRGRRPRNRRRRKMCVANTHIFWDPEYADVKLWQTWVLCQELSKLVLSRDLPLLLCGDFNSVPNSAVYQLLSHQQIRSNDHEAFTKDRFGLLPPFTEMTHHLVLDSAYNPIGEPQYTNYTGHFVGVLDYVWYSRHHLRGISVLDVNEERDLCKETALPNSELSSDHICLMAELCWVETENEHQSM